MTVTDKTGAPTEVAKEAERYTISVDGRQVGVAEFLDRGDRRIFTHTKVDKDYEGRGLATILVEHALRETKAAGLTIVPKCSMVVAFVDKHPEYRDDAAG
jgi:uncharacterized protein